MSRSVEHAFVKVTGVVAPRVRLTVGRGYGDLELWGRDPDGRWWALVSWEAWLGRGFATPDPVLCSGWASSDHVLQTPGVNYERVTRIALTDDKASWPRPPNGLHFGVLLPGQKPEPPEGMRWTQPRLNRRERQLRYEQAPPQ
jgi:hypothetical protein